MGNGSPRSRRRRCACAVSTPGARSRFHRALDRDQLTGEFPGPRPRWRCPRRRPRRGESSRGSGWTPRRRQWRSTAASHGSPSRNRAAPKNADEACAAGEAAGQWAPQVQRARPLVDGAGAVEQPLDRPVDEGRLDPEPDGGPEKSSLPAGGAGGSLAAPPAPATRGRGRQPRSRCTSAGRSPAAPGGGASNQSSTARSNRSRPDGIGSGRGLQRRRRRPARSWAEPRRRPKAPAAPIRRQPAEVAPPGPLRHPWRADRQPGQVAADCRAVLVVGAVVAEPARVWDGSPPGRRPARPRSRWRVICWRRPWID